jgi:hypothetical protein
MGALFSLDSLVFFFQLLVVTSTLKTLESEEARIQADESFPVALLVCGVFSLKQISAIRTCTI